MSPVTASPESDKPTPLVVMLPTVVIPVLLLILTPRDPAPLAVTLPQCAVTEFAESEMPLASGPDVVTLPQVRSIVPVGSSKAFGSPEFMLMPTDPAPPVVTSPMITDATSAEVAIRPDD